MPDGRQTEEIAEESHFLTPASLTAKLILALAIGKQTLSNGLHVSLTTILRSRCTIFQYRLKVLFLQSADRLKGEGQLTITLSVIKADIGGYVGHSESHPDVIQCAHECLAIAKKSRLLIDYHVTKCGDDLQLIMTHQRGEEDEKSISWPGIPLLRAPKWPKS